MKKTLLFLLINIPIFSFAQFQFSGKVSLNYKNATAYLSVIDNYKDVKTFQTENIVAHTNINTLGEFLFSGDFLNNRDQFYRIYIDNCEEDIKNAKHLLNKCTNYSSLLFIANNTDTIRFPLNDLGQMLCEFKSTRIESQVIFQMNALQEELLFSIENAISDKQRNLIYKNYFQQLKQFSQTLNHPLAELYAYQLYAHENLFSRKFYLNDLSKNLNYYSNLKARLHKEKLDKYANQLKKDILFDSNCSTTEPNYFIYVLLSSLLFISLYFNYKNYYKKEKKINYKNILTKQEQKVFEEMNKGLSNQEIADKLFVSISTIKTHISNIYGKLKISSRKEIEHFF